MWSEESMTAPDIELPDETRRHLVKAVDLLRSGRYPRELAASYLEMAAHSVVDVDAPLGAEILDCSRVVRGGGLWALGRLHRVVAATGLLDGK